MNKQQKDYGYITRYKMGGTTYESETTFSGTETLNNKIIRLMLNEKIKIKEADKLQFLRKKQIILTDSRLIFSSFVIL